MVGSGVSHVTSMMLVAVRQNIFPLLSQAMYQADNYSSGILVTYLCTPLVFQAEYEMNDSCTDQANLHYSLQWHFPKNMENSVIGMN